jgi:hypothetical protein
MFSLSGSRHSCRSSKSVWPHTLLMCCKEGGVVGRVRDSRQSRGGLGVRSGPLHALWLVLQLLCAWPGRARRVCAATFTRLVGSAVRRLSPYVHYPAGSVLFGRTDVSCFV